MILDQLVELKGGETFNGHLVSCDSFMNIILREVYQTSAEGDRYWKLKECYIRGSTVSYFPIYTCTPAFDLLCTTVTGIPLSAPSSRRLQALTRPRFLTILCRTDN